MRHCKKKTIALCLASMIAVLGAFGADNYKNSLVTLKINKGSGGQVSLTAFTRKPLSVPITVEKTGEEMFSVFIPDTYSEMSAMPNITGFDNIESLIVSTYPYTTKSEGYTAIHIKTKGNPSIITNSSVYIEGSSAFQPKLDDKNVYIQTPTIPVQKKKQESYWEQFEGNKTNKSNLNNNDAIKQTGNNSYQVSKQPKLNSEEAKGQNNASQDFTFNYNPENTATDNTNERIAVTFGFMLLVLIIFFIYFIGKDKMKAVIGEHSNYSFDEDKEKIEKRKKEHKISKSINKLDNMYKNTYSQSKESSESVQPEEETDDDIIVDLDSLYKEKTRSEETESNENDLETLLNSFRSLNDDIVKEKSDDILYDDLLYQDIINNTRITFSKNDIDKINDLMRNELDAETIRNVSKYVTKPTKSKNQVLEDLLAEYVIKQNLTFSKDDVDAIKKIMDVELDKTFITDLRVNKNRTGTMYAELAEKRETRLVKPNPELILNVKNFLPDLSEELKKQGNKPIESNAKAEVVYYSEGYDVNILSVGNELADLTKNISISKDNSYRPSDDIVIDATGYDVQTLSIKDDYPDLVDVKASSKKYETLKPKEHVGDDQLLKNLSHITFKPFYEEEHSDSDTEVELQKEEEDNLSVITDIPEIIQTDSVKEIKQDEVIEAPKAETIADSENIQRLRRNYKFSPSKVNNDAQELLKLIEEQQNRRQNLKQLRENNKDAFSVLSDKTTTEMKKHNNVEIDDIRYEKDGRKYKVIKKAQCSDNAVCYIAKSGSRYAILGKINEKIIELKFYDKLRTETIQARLNEKMPDGSCQYLVRISIHKIIINIKDNDMEFVMDLC